MMALPLGKSKWASGPYLSDEASFSVLRFFLGALDFFFFSLSFL